MQRTPDSCIGKSPCAPAHTLHLAPQVPNQQLNVMMEESTREFSARKWPMLSFLDTHSLEWLEDAQMVY
ncbi:hypothetical protein SUGI_0649830 [Cryptomeria japonica]|nr:hypothetical protein SUGI_0649830 [Cryptomeria japonica]